MGALRQVAIGIVAAVVLSACAMHGPARPEAQGDDHAGAVAANFWYAPGRAITCGTSAIISSIVMALTFGHAYEGASAMMHGACSGPWTVTGQEVRNAVE
jgi:hypothetical protein